MSGENATVKSTPIVFTHKCHLARFVFNHIYEWWASAVLAFCAGFHMLRISASYVGRGLTWYIYTSVIWAGRKWTVMRLGVAPFKLIHFLRRCENFDNHEVVSEHLETAAIHVHTSSTNYLFLHRGHANVTISVSLLLLLIKSQSG